MTKLEGISESHQEWPNSDRSLNLLTRYVDERHRKEGKIEPPKFRVNKDETVTIFLDGNVNMKRLLPRKLVIYNEKDFGLSMYGGTMFWDEDVGSLLETRVGFDVSWVEKNGEWALCGVAHEIGHVLSMEYVTRSANYIKDRLPGYRYPYKSVEDFENFLTRSLHDLSVNLNEEVQAYNYGKIVADCFGVDPTNFEGHIEPPLKSHIANDFFQCRKFVSQRLAEFEESTGSRFSTEKHFRIYDTTLQSDVEVTFEQLMIILGRYDEEEIKRTKEELVRSGRYN